MRNHTFERFISPDHDLRLGVDPLVLGHDGRLVQLPVALVEHTAAGEDERLNTQQAWLVNVDARQ